MFQIWFVITNTQVHKYASKICKYKNTKCWKDLTHAISFKMHGIWGYQILDSRVSFYIWSWFYGPFFFMAHGTGSCVLPFNWFPNSGQLIDEASRGPLDPIFIVILMTCVASFSEFIDWFTYEMQKEFCENNKWMPPRMNVGADPFSCLRPSNLTGTSIFNTQNHLEDLKHFKKPTNFVTPD